MTKLTPAVVRKLTPFGLIYSKNAAHKIVNITSSTCHNSTLNVLVYDKNIPNGALMAT